jgi:hypothetical protein
MLDEPPLPEPDVDLFTHLCLEKGKVVVHVIPAAISSLRWDFWFLAAKCPVGESIDLSDSGERPGMNDCAPVRYCEITLTGEGPISGVLHNPVAEYLHREPRIDLFVNRLQAERGYHSLLRLGGIEAGKVIQQVELFGRLIVRLTPAPSAL